MKEATEKNVYSGHLIRLKVTKGPDYLVIILLLQHCIMIN